MLIARWIVNVRFGKKDAFIKRIQQWYDEVGDKVGLNRNSLRVVTGSIGAAESRFEFDHTIESLGALQKMWDEMAKLEAHTKFGQDLGPLIVDGSNHWEVFRSVDL